MVGGIAFAMTGRPISFEEVIDIEEIQWLGGPASIQGLEVLVVQ